MGFTRAWIDPLVSDPCFWKRRDERWCVLSAEARRSTEPRPAPQASLGLVACFRPGQGLLAGAYTFRQQIFHLLTTYLGMACEAIQNTCVHMHIPTRTLQHPCEGHRAGDAVPVSEKRAVRLSPNSLLDPGLQPMFGHP